ncbi:MAG: hypothetical protein COU67_02700 [Candidatus Pacebacteria bacterium CG10_big_fil_rev_8_21_14_0_10_44_54]|nr:hypothetical protein [bacterium]PIR60300.1 MAG: hypothetical protein COU67_02700 [Candidatus Pacebacteria bacterium CG10_big_fil_rev_8_21_14_0_10_44_54]
MDITRGVEIRKTYSEAWEFFKTHWKLVYKVGLIYFVLAHLPQITLEAVFSYYAASESGLAVFVSFLLMFWQSLIGMGGTVVMLSLLRKREQADVSLEQLFFNRR